MNTLSDIVRPVTATFTALSAGLFFAYACSVSPGLERLPDTGYIVAMQSINRAIQNPVFFTVFLGPLLLLPLSAYLCYAQPVPVRFGLLLAAAAIYYAGVFGVTVAGNVPLNDALEAFDLRSASVGEAAAQRARFESAWNRLNLVRTLASVLVAALSAAACLYPAQAAEQ